MRVHEHLLSRGDLGPRDRERAQHALALDFLKAGLLDRAEDALARLEGTPFEEQARLALLAIYERSRDWPRAATIARQMQDAGQGNFSTRQAHYLCEQALEHVAHGDIDKARDLLDKAHASAPQAPRPRIELARLAQAQGQPDTALALLKALATEAPAALPLAATLLVKTAQASQQTALALEVLQQHYAAAPSLDVLDAIVVLTTPAMPQSEDGRQWYLRHLEAEPSLVAAAKWLADERLEHEQYHAQVQRALDHAAQPLLRYRCAACGFEARQHFWQCPGCQSWDSYPACRCHRCSSPAAIQPGCTCRASDPTR